MRKEGPPSTETGLAKENKKISLKEMLFLAEQAGSESGLKVLPGTKWGVHIPSGRAKHDVLKDVLDAKISPSEAESLLQPDGITYDVKDLETEGLQAVSAKIRDLSLKIAGVNYQNMAEFIAEFRQQNFELEDMIEVYDSLSQTKARQSALDRLGFTGKQQVKSSASRDIAGRLAKFDGLNPLNRIITALDANRLILDQGVVSPEQLSTLQSQLSQQEAQLIEILGPDYNQFIESRDPQLLQNVIDKLKENAVIVEKISQTQQETRQELIEELEPFKDKVSPPMTEQDPGIAPEDRDEYLPSQPVEHEQSGEKQRPLPFFTITPAGSSDHPLIGYFASGHKSYFDRQRLVWSKQKQLTPFTQTNSSDTRWQIRGKIDSGTTAIPLPVGYEIDSKSFQFANGQASLQRDQNGCFYINSSGETPFSVEFSLAQTPFTGSLVASDSEPLHSGSFSPETESLITSLAGSSRQKAQTLAGWVVSNHYYPDGGDLQSASALQFKLKSESTSENYISNLEASKYLECYSANTLLLAMLRRAGIPSRLVLGHRVENAHDNQSNIDQTTGHAWAEFWDGSVWVRIDGTPAPKPCEMKKDQQKELSSPSEEAKGDQVDVDSAQKPDDIENVGDEEFSDGQDQIDQAKEKIQEMNEKSKQISQKISLSQKFQELDQNQEEIDQAELTDEMKQELENQNEAKKNQMLDELNNRIDKLHDDGFIDDDKLEELKEKIEEKQSEELDDILSDISNEMEIADEYEQEKAEIMPLVDKWYQYFADKLPKKEEIGLDEDSLTRQGQFDRRSISRPRNLLFGTVKNPRTFESSFEPRFIAMIMIDISGSMEQNNKLGNARKLLIFYNELFSRISQEFGYIRFGIYAFADSIKTIKEFDADYESNQRYAYEDGQIATVKYRLMTGLQAKGGTDMLSAVKQAGQKLNEQSAEFPDHLTSLYFMGDGEDTNGNQANIGQFISETDSRKGFGEHLLSAILLGDESARSSLAQVFGDQNTSVAGDLNSLIEKSMEKFDDDIESYLAFKT